MMQNLMGSASSTASCIEHIQNENEANQLLLTIARIEKPIIGLEEVCSHQVFTWGRMNRINVFGRCMRSRTWISNNISLPSKTIIYVMVNHLTFGLNVTTLGECGHATSINFFYHVFFNVEPVIDHNTRFFADALLDQPSADINQYCHNTWTPIQYLTFNHHTQPDDLVKRVIDLCSDETLSGDSSNYGRPIVNALYNEHWNMLDHILDRVHCDGNGVNLLVFFGKKDIRHFTQHEILRALGFLEPPKKLEGRTRITNRIRSIMQQTQRYWSHIPAFLANALMNSFDGVTSVLAPIVQAYLRNPYDF